MVQDSIHTHWPSQGPASFLATEDHRSTCRQLPILGLWRSLRCDLLHPDILSILNPAAGCQSCPCCPGQADEVKYPSSVFPSMAAAPGPAKASEDLGSLFLGKMKGCSLSRVPPSPLPSTGARVWGDKSKLSNLGRGGIWSPCQSQEVFGSEGIGTGRFLILGLSRHRMESALIGTSPGEGADGELLLLELPCNPGKDKAIGNATS